jgi:hypothetical protein
MLASWERDTQFFGPLSSSNNFKLGKLTLRNERLADSLARRALYHRRCGVTHNLLTLKL